MSIIKMHTHNYNNDKLASLRRDIDFKLSLEEYIALYTNKCYYCDTKPNRYHLSDGIGFKYGSIDRKDSNKGYTVDNCVSSCIMCNLYKEPLSDEHFILMLKHVKYEHLKIDNYCQMLKQKDFMNIINYNEFVLWGNNVIKKYAPGEPL